MDYARFISPISARRKPSAIRSLNKMLGIPGMISLGGGNPHPNTFPFISFSFKLRNGESVEVSEQDTARALQYSATNGLQDLVEWLKQLQTHVHKPPISDFDICVGNGSQDVLTKAFDMLIKEGDTILCESPAYVGSLAFLKPLGCKFAEVEIDKDGLVPQVMEDLLSKFDDATRPKLLYSVPTGGNPTGISTTLLRKQQIYAIAKKYDMLILEDDPYHYLSYGPRIPSYFSMDSDGRVLRFDSLSKILSSGIRVGWVTGPRPLVDRIVLHGQASNLHSSGVSQMLTIKLLERWGLDGFLNHTVEVSQFYKGKSVMFLKAAEKHLKGLAEWSIPSAGMFVWIKLLGIEDSSNLIRTKAVENKVLLVPGVEFFPNPRVTSYVRASFSTASEEEMNTALERLATLLRKEKEGSSQ
ncbi:pyridoxal phosphate-dependent transferase [Zopfochytrium polystomum]|nr:pyridoxal phosphate-dependent transferase [Zopfochytrium polystomum]